MLESASFLQQTDIKGLKTEQNAWRVATYISIRMTCSVCVTGSKILSLRENDKQRIRLNQHASLS
jgi:hypothetical protein